jgi:hypothetical protein
MATNSLQTQDLLRQALIKVADLSDEDLPVVIEFLDYLKEQRQDRVEGRLTPADIRNLARRRSFELRDIPRQEIATRFKQLVEEIRTQAIARGTAIEGDWRGD